MERAIQLGASLSGVTSIDKLRDAPSHEVCRTVPLPSGATSVLVLALSHKESEPELDWWGVKGGSSGNRKLQEISEELRQWVKTEYGLLATPLPYDPEKGGIFLKDAAALAGVGVLGANNLLITPQYGARVRLRAISFGEELEPTGPKDFSPCDSCHRPCIEVCPQNALETGLYSRDRCEVQMNEDVSNRVILEQWEEDGTQSVRIKYCRACELACPVGQKT
jgi:epoxyqueuosine reductase